MVGLDGGDGFAVDLAGGAVQGDPVALGVGLAAQFKGVVAHLDLGATGDAAGAHAAGDDRSVGGHAAAHGEDTLRGNHAFDVLRRGLQTHEDDLVALLSPLGGVLGSEHHLTAGSARGGGKAGADGLGGLQGLGIKHGVQQAVQLLGLHAQHGLFLGDHALVHQVDGDLQGGGGGALAVAGLQHVKFAVFNGELHILHVAVVVFEVMGDALELLVHRGHILFQFGDGAGRAHAGHNVFALGVDEVLAKQGLFAGGGGRG